MVNIGFCTDTNILKINPEALRKSENIFKGIDFYVDYIKDLLKTNSDKKLIYYMPKYILDELTTQKVLIYNERYESFKNAYEELSYGLNGDMPNNIIMDYLSDLRRKYEENLKIIDLNYSKDVFDKLVCDAFNRKPPYDKSNDGKKTDSGFKDAVIWNTILNSDEINECDEFYFFSGDKIFDDNKQELSDEFKRYHSKTKINIIFVEPNGTQQQKSLQTIINNHNLIETEKVKLYNEDLIIKTIVEIKYDLDHDITYTENDTKIYLNKINFNEFDGEDFNIYDVIKNGNNYEVKIDFDTLKYDIKEELEIKNKKKLRGRLLLIFVKEQNEFKLISHEIKNVEFITDYFSYFIKGITESINNLLDNNLKSTIGLLSETIAKQIEPMNKISETLKNITLKNLDYNIKYINNISLPNLDSNDEENNN